MKKIFFVFIFGTILLLYSLVGCATDPPPTTVSLSPSITPSSSPTRKVVPTLTPNPSATSTLNLPVLPGTPVPIPDEPITPQNINRLQLLAVWGKGEVKHLVYSPNGRFLAVGSTAGIWVYETETQELLRFKLINTPIEAMAFLPDSETLTAQIGGNTIIRWNAATQKDVVSWVVGVRELKNVAFAPDGETLASALEDGQIGIWEIESGRLIKTLKNEATPAQSIGTLTFSPNGEFLAVELMEHHTIDIWAVEMETLLHSLEAHPEVTTGPLQLKFSPDNKLLASGGFDIQLWQVATGNLLHTMNNKNGRIQNLAFSPDSELLASASANLILWDVTDGKLQYTIESRMGTIAFSPEGKIFASSDNEKSIQLWHSKTGTPLGILEGFGKGAFDLETSDDGLVFISQSNIPAIETNGIQEWDVRTGDVISVIAPNVSAHYLATSHDGQILASTTHDGYYHTGENPVRIWNTPDGQLDQSIGGYSGPLSTLSLSPDGQITIIAYDAYDIRANKIRYSLNPNFREIIHSTFSPDGVLLAYALDNGVVKVVDATTGELRHELPAPARYFDNGLEFSPDSAVLAVGYGENSTIHFWDTLTGTDIKTLIISGRETTDISFSPDGSTFVSGTRGGPIQFWHGKSGQLLRSIDTPEIKIVRFTLDGRLLVSVALWDGVVRLWGIQAE